MIIPPTGTQGLLMSSALPPAELALGFPLAETNAIPVAIKSNHTDASDMACSRVKPLPVGPIAAL